MTWPAWWLGGFVLLSGCVSSTGASREPVPFTVAVGNEFVVAPDGISFRLDSVVNDSRCPVDVICIQAGSVVLKFTWASPAHPTPVVLLLDSTVPETVAGVRLTVTSIEPIRHQNVAVAQSDYRVHLTAGRP